MIEPPRPTDAEMAVYDAGKIDGVNRSKPCEDMPQSMYELWRPSKAPIYLTPDEAEQILCFDPHQPGVLQIQPDVITKCEAWLAWKAEQDARMSGMDAAYADGWRAEGEMSKERALIRDMVAAELATQRGPHGKFREVVRRIVREELADAIKDEMQEMRDAIDRLRRAFSGRDG